MCGTLRSKRKFKQFGICQYSRIKRRVSLRSFKYFKVGYVCDGVSCSFYWKNVFKGGRSIFGQMGSLLKQMGSFLITGMLLTLIPVTKQGQIGFFGVYGKLFHNLIGFFKSIKLFEDLELLFSIY